MTTFPLATLAATVSATGIAAPSLNDILSSLIASYQGIYGADVYLGPDSQDGQWLGIIAAAIHDANNAAVAVYNQFSPQTALGTGLSANVKLNGLARAQPTFSTITVTIVGQAGTTIVSGLVGDNLGLGTQWALPTTVVVPTGGSITVTATSTAAGNVSLAAGTGVILTPVPGWQTATFATAALPGAPLETDAALRLRQSRSTSLPSQTRIASLVGQVLAISGVSRVKGYVNDGYVTDSNGLPPHTISMVVLGGSASVIAAVIADGKGPGTGTYGTTSNIVIDAVGVPDTVKYNVLTLVTVSVLVNAKALTGYVGSTGTLLGGALAQFLSGLDIGETSYLSRLWAPAGLNGDAATGSSGLSQAALDPLAATYSVLAPFGIAQARSNMTTTVIANAGATVFTVTSTANYAVGQTVYVTLSATAFLQTTVAAVTSTTITTVAAVPVGSTVAVGSLIYVAGDVAMAYNEAATALASNVTLVTS